MDSNTQRGSWACPLARRDASAPDASPARAWRGEVRPFLLPCYCPEAARCACEGRCARADPPGRESRHWASGGPGPGLHWPLQARDASNLSGGGGAKGQDPLGLPPATSLDALVELFPAPSPSRASGFQEKLSLASECLFAARHEIQRSIRTPISLRDISVLSDLLKRVSDLLGADTVATALGRPVSGQELANSGYRLLDTAHEYNLLAQHFYSDEVQAARAGRPSDSVEAEIAAVACKAASLKHGVMKYLKKAEEALQKKTAPLN